MNNTEPFWLTSNMGFWRDTFLPKWICNMRYSSVTIWVRLLGKLGGVPVSHLGKSKLKQLLHRHPSYKTAVGGCTDTASDWPDPARGP